MREPRLPVIEHRFLQLLWDGRHEEAAKVLGRHLKLAFRESRRLGACICTGRRTPSLLPASGGGRGSLP